MSDIYSKSIENLSKYDPSMIVDLINLASFPSGVFDKSISVARIYNEFINNEIDMSGIVININMHINDEKLYSVSRFVDSINLPKVSKLIKFKPIMNQASIIELGSKVLKENFAECFVSQSIRAGPDRKVITEFRLHNRALYEDIIYNIQHIPPINRGDITTNLFEDKTDDFIKVRIYSITLLTVLIKCCKTLFRHQPTIVRRRSRSPVRRAYTPPGSPTWRTRSSSSIVSKQTEELPAPPPNKLELVSLLDFKTHDVKMSYSIPNTIESYSKKHMNFSPAIIQLDEQKGFGTIWNIWALKKFNNKSPVRAVYITITIYHDNSARYTKKGKLDYPNPRTINHLIKLVFGQFKFIKFNYKFSHMTVDFNCILMDGTKLENIILTDEFNRPFDNDYLASFREFTYGKVDRYFNYMSRIAGVDCKCSVHKINSITCYCESINNYKCDPVTCVQTHVSHIIHKHCDANYKVNEVYMEKFFKLTMY